MHGMQLPGPQETSPKHSPGRHFPTNKEPGDFTISTCEKLLVREGQLEQPCKQQPVIAEACAQGKAQQGLGAWALCPSKGSSGHGEPRPQHCPLLGQDGQEASRETSPEPCSRTQDLRENCALSPPLDTGPCGFPQCAKS